MKSAAIPPAVPPGLPPARGDRHLIFALLSVSMLSFIMQFGMVAVSIGQLTTDLHSPLRWSGWVLTIFMVGQVVAMPVAGRLTERFGARAVFAVGFVFFAASSFVCAIAPNIYVLILARAVQGAAGGGLAPAGTSLIGEAYGAGRTRAIGLYSSLMPFGAVLGPVVGGVIVEQLGWRWTFGFNAPLGFVVCLLAFVVLPPGQRRPIQRLDYGGMALIALTMTSLIFALTELGQRGVAPDYRLVAIAALVCVVSGAVLAYHEQRTAQPVIDLDLLKRGEFAATNAISFCFGMGWTSVATMIPLYAQTAYGLSVTRSGALLSPRAAVMVTVSALSAYALPRTGFRKPLVAGLVGLSVSLVIIAMGIKEPRIAGVVLPNFYWLLLLVGSAGIFFGFANPSMNNAGLELEPDRIASIAGLRGMFQNLGGTLGISLVVLIASRAETTAAGMQDAFRVLAMIVLASTIFVLKVPELGSAHRMRLTPAEDGRAGDARGRAGAPSRSIGE